VLFGPGDPLAIGYSGNYLACLISACVLSAKTALASALVNGITVVNGVLFMLQTGIS
jgi:hypothetical protein